MATFSKQLISSSTNGKSILVQSNVGGGQGGILGAYGGTVGRG